MLSPVVVSRVRPAVVATGCVGIRSPHFTPVSKGSVALEHGQQIPVDPKMRSGIGRAWWTEVVFDGIESELAWLRETVYEGMWRYLPAGGSTSSARDGVRALEQGSGRFGATGPRLTGRAGAVCGVGEGSPVAIRSMVGVECGFWPGFPRHWSMAPRSPALRLVPAGRPVGVADLLLASVHEREHPFRASGRGLMQPLVRSEIGLPRAMPKRTGANPVHSLGRPRHESVRDAAPQDGMFLHRLCSQRRRSSFAQKLVFACRTFPPACHARSAGRIDRLFGARIGRFPSGSRWAGSGIAG